MLLIILGHVSIIYHTRGEELLGLLKDESLGEGHDSAPPYE